MTKENIQEFAVALQASPSEGADEGSEAKRNKKTQLLSALLSASALGVFLEGCGGGDTSGGRRGSESNPYLATDAADSFTGETGYDWVSYAGSNEGVSVDLSSYTATVSGGWAEGDTLSGINNLIGSDHDDTLTGNHDRNSFRGGTGDDVLVGGRGNDVLAGEGDTDTYVFNAGDGADRVIDDGGRIVFEQGTNDDYAGATYTFAYVERSSDVRLTVINSDSLLNTIDFASHPSSYTFTTRSGGSDIEIPNTSLVIPARRGGESNPFMATDATDRFTGEGNFDWVSYAGSNTGVTIDLDDNPATVSGGWAAGDTLTYIDNLIGSIHDDTLIGGSSLEGGRGNDVLAEADTYVFNKGDGTDTITDSGSNKIVFEQGTNNNDYAGVTYAFAYVEGSSDVRLTVTNSGSTLNTIDFTIYPDAYTFYTRSGSDITTIPDASLVLPVRRGSASNPFVATDAADRFSGSRGYNWVSYADSNEGVTVDLSDNPATVSDGWAAGDTLTYIDNLIGSIHDDTLIGGSSLKGGRGNDVLAEADTYVFNTGDGTDTITDYSISNKIVFEQGTDNNDYEGATYTFSNVERSSDVRLTVAKGSETLNTIDFTIYPSDYTFYTRSGGINTEIPESSLVIPARRGSASNPYLATAGDDSFTGTGIYNWVSYADSNEGVTVDLGGYFSHATVSGGWAAGDRLRNIDNLIGSIHDDTLSGDSGVNTLRGGAGNDDIDGGSGNDNLYGEGGADTYRFYAMDRLSNDGYDVIKDGNTDGTGNKLIFAMPDPDLVYFYNNAPLEEFTFSSQNFDFSRTGDDLRISVTAIYKRSSETISQKSNTVTIEDYFTLSDDAYTIYSTSYGSSSDGTIVSTQPAETS